MYLRKLKFVVIIKKMVQFFQLLFFFSNTVTALNKSIFKQAFKFDILKA